MTPIRYEDIAANIAEAVVDKAQVQVRWKCPLTGCEVGASAASMASDASLSTRVSASVKRSIAYEVIYGVARFVSGLLGGAAGRVIANAAYTVAGDVNTRVTSGVDYSEASRQAAIVAAFELVKDSFERDPQRGQWVARRSAPS